MQNGRATGAREEDLDGGDPPPSLSSGGFRHRREILNCEGKAEENRNKQLKPHKTAEPLRSGHQHQQNSAEIRTVWKLARFSCNYFHLGAALITLGWHFSFSQASQSSLESRCSNCKSHNPQPSSYLAESTLLHAVSTVQTLD